jgi:hypothetical protein
MGATLKAKVEEFMHYYALYVKVVDGEVLV